MFALKTAPQLGDGLFTLRQTFSQIKIEKEAIMAKAEDAAALLNHAFETPVAGTANLFVMGSWVRETAVPTISDYDFAYELPARMTDSILHMTRRDAGTLTAIIEKTLREKYNYAHSLADEGVIRLKTMQGEIIDIRPCLRNESHHLIYLDHRKGGKWRIFDPYLGIDVFRALPQQIRDNLIFLCRASRIWRATHKVPISGILIDTLAHEFIHHSLYRHKNNQFQDCLFRDFMGFLAQCDREQPWWYAPASTEVINRTGPFESYAEEAFRQSQQATEQFAARHYRQAGLLWMNVFGDDYSQL